MSKRISIKFESKRIEISETMAKKAATPFSPEFNELMEVTKSLPDYKVVIKKKPPVKRSHSCGLNYEFMYQHLMAHDNDERLEEYKVLRSGGATYAQIRNWFLNRFPEIAELHKAA